MDKTTTLFKNVFNIICGIWLSTRFVFILNVNPKKMKLITLGFKLCSTLQNSLRGTLCSDISKLLYSRRTYKCVYVLPVHNRRIYLTYNSQ